MKFFYTFLYFFLCFFIFQSNCRAWQLDCQLSQARCEAAAATFWQQKVAEPEEWLLHFDQILPKGCQLWLQILSQTALSDEQKSFLAESRLAVVDRSLILGQANAKELLESEQLLLGQVPQVYFLHLRWFFPDQEWTEESEWQYELHWRFSCPEQSLEDLVSSPAAVASASSEEEQSDSATKTLALTAPDSFTSTAVAKKTAIFIFIGSIFSFLFLFALLQWKRLRKQKKPH
jgi:hypothetical protein